MKIRLFLISILLSIVGFLLYNLIDRSSETAPIAFQAKSSFNRANLISKVAKGDKDAAFDLGIYYEREDLPEAAYYWFGVAFKLGNRNVSQSFLDDYEPMIIGKYDSGPW